MKCNKSVVVKLKLIAAIYFLYSYISPLDCCFCFSCELAYIVERKHNKPAVDSFQIDLFFDFEQLIKKRKESK